MEWKTIERPGYFGKKRDEIYKNYNEEFGLENWRIAWELNGKTIPFEIACLIYEDGYYTDSFRRENLWKELTSAAKGVGIIVNLMLNLD